MTDLSDTHSTNWSDEDLDRLRLMWCEGVATGCIARELRRTVPAVYHRARILRLPKRWVSNAARPKPPPVIVAAPVPVPTQVIAPPSGLPPSLRYEDDSRAAARERFMVAPPPRTGDVTAAFMGDPAPGRSAA